MASAKQKLTGEPRKTIQLTSVRTDSLRDKQSKIILRGEHFYKFFQCPHWIWYDLYGDQCQKKETPKLLEMIHRGGLRHDHEKLLIQPRTFEEVKPELFNDLDEAFLATVELMKQEKNIYHGVLMDEHWVGMPDLLEARPVEKGMKSKFGSYYYVAYDIRSGGYIPDEIKFQLVFYSLILERLQGVMPQKSYIIDGEGKEHSFTNEDFLEQFHLARESIEKILEGEKPPPFLKSGCKQSPWYALCTEEAVGCQDVSLIYGLSQSDQRKLYDAGIHTVSQLAGYDMNKLQEKMEGWTFDKVLRFYNQANSLISRKPIILKKNKFPEVGTEVYFDIESDPTRSIDYLLGILVKKGSKKPEYMHFLSDSKEDEPKVWNQFLDFIESLEDFVIYHYSFYEREVFKRLSNKYGISSALAGKFSDNTIDLHRSVVESAVLPLYFYSLKDVAKYLGFNWRAEDAGGAESVVWYDEWLRTGNKKILQKILDYNEDDLLATKFLKEWLERQKPTLGAKERLD
ncbi:MAG: Uncharacterized protein CEN90_774 [Parcubacteria group bacterium Licking1014_17]|nr:MAG: Uncharacterized protein CEN90_774 [Parcubacteria group bacterium Licking1014_17]